MPQVIAHVGYNVQYSGGVPSSRQVANREVGTNVPKVVDHANRREELARAALRVIGRDGLEAATTRAVAQEAGWSTGVLKHYFTNKDQLLHQALRELERLNLVRFQEAALQPSGFASIRSAIIAILDASHDESRVWTAFINRASIDGPSGESMRYAIEAWVGRWQQLIVRGQHDGSIRDDLDARRLAIELHALVNGLRLGTLFLSTGTEGRSESGRVELALLGALAPMATSHADPAELTSLSQTIRPRRTSRS